MNLNVFLSEKKHQKHKSEDRYKYLNLGLIFWILEILMPVASSNALFTYNHYVAEYGYEM